MLLLCSVHFFKSGIKTMCVKRLTRYCTTYANLALISSGVYCILTFKISKNLNKILRCRNFQIKKSITITQPESTYLLNEALIIVL